MTYTSVRALYYVSANNAGSSQEGHACSTSHFNACYGQKGEKASYFNASPSGKAKLWVEPGAFPFPAGQHCWFDFDPVSEGVEIGENEYLMRVRLLTERFAETDQAAKSQEEVLLSNKSHWAPGRCEFEVTIANPGAWGFFEPGRLYRLKITKAEV